MSIFEGGFEEPTERFPDKIFTEVTKDFSIVTEGLAKLVLIEVVGTDRLEASALQSKRFRFKVVLMSALLPGYSFEVLEFGYDISIFPVFLDIEEGIETELEVKSEIDDEWKRYYLCETEEIFEQRLSEIFATQKFKKTVGGVMKIARSKQPMSSIAQTMA